jgi:hypothetical protein
MRRLALLLVVSALLATYPIAGKVIGRRARLDPVLQMLETPLHARGIDVVAGNTAAYKIGSRPRLAPLTGMPTAKASADWNSRPWMDEFRRGATGFVAGVKSTRGRRAANSDEFLSAWRAASRDRRVFISFTAKDAGAAEAAAKALTAKGYVAFVFIRPSASAPTYDTALVGRMFHEAGHHFVVDTPNARKSAGVWLEATIAKGFRGPEGTGGGTRPAPKPRTPAPSESWSGRERFLRDIDSWVVTRNPDIPGKLFIHRESTGAMLVDLLYTVKVESNGSWVVYDKYGSRLGKLSNPPDVSIGRCSCH